MVQFNLNQPGQEMAEEDEPPSLEDYVSSEINEVEKEVESSMAQETIEMLLAENYEFQIEEDYLNPEQLPTEEKTAELSADSRAYLFNLPDLGSFCCEVTDDDWEISPAAMPMKLFLAVVAKATMLRELQESGRASYQQNDKNAAQARTPT